MSHSDKTLTRRRFVEATGVATAVGIAGCDGLGGGGDPLEVLHGWTGGDGAEAEDALVEAFEEEYPDMEAEFNPIGGGGNQNLDTVVANRLSNNDPPSSFANWPGNNLQRYSDTLGDIDDVWDENDFEDAHIDEAIDLHQQDGAFRAVPLGSHRLNNLFWNVGVVEDAGVDPSGITDMQALLDALDTVATETDATPMTNLMAGTWGTTQLWGVIMLGQEGYQPYMDFMAGEGDEDAVRASFETLGTILENYISDDASSLDLTASNNNIIDGNAAFLHQGNWAAGAFGNAEGFNYQEDWGAKAFPGTEGMYTLHFDSFLYPSDNPSESNSKDWMAFVGSTAAQEAFNPLKGSIPTRTDADMSVFNQYLQDTQEDFQNADQRPPTLQHGLAVTSEKMSALNDVISNQFMGPFDVDAATSGFMDAV